MTSLQHVTEYDTGDFGKVAVVARDCPLCGRDNSDALENRYSHPFWKIKDCRDCGFVYIDKAPIYEAQASTMAWELTTKIEEVRRSKLRPISYKFSKLTRARLHILPRLTMHGLVDTHARPGNVIDLGCSNGAELSYLPDRFTPFGIEISENSAPAANARFIKRGGQAICAPSLDGLKSFKDAFFSAATLRSYLEHETHPVPVLHELHRTLEPSGVAIIKVPNYGSINRVVTGKRWCGFRYPDHLNYFTPRTLQAMAEKCGYRVWFGLTHRLMTSDNMYAILTKI
jgi:SAM-dependent methyltransferase